MDLEKIIAAFKAKLEGYKELDIEGVDAFATEIRETFKQMKESGEIDLEFGNQLADTLSVLDSHREELVKEAQTAAEEAKNLENRIFGADPSVEGEGAAEGEGEGGANASAENADQNADNAAEGEENADGEGAAEGEASDEGAEGEGEVNSQASSPRRIYKLPTLGQASNNAQVTNESEGSDEPVFNEGKIFDEDGKEISKDSLQTVFQRAGRSAKRLTSTDLARDLDVPGAVSKTHLVSLSVSDAIPTVGANKDFATSEEAFQSALKDKREELEANVRAVASGGACAPRRQEYAIRALGGDSQPVGSSLVTVSSDGKGVSFFRDLEFSTIVSDWAGGINSYTHAQDVSGSAYPKGIATIACPTPSTCDKEIREKAIRFGNWMNWAFPELIAAVERGGDAVFARHLEEKRLAAIYTYGASTLGNYFDDTIQTLDGSTNVIDKILRIVSRDRIDNRYGTTEGRYIAYFPDWLKGEITVGLRSMLDGTGDNLSLESAVQEILSRWNVSFVFYRDSFGTGAGAVPASIQNAAGTDFPLWPTKARIGIVRDDAVYLDRGPTLDLGLVRTQEDIEENNYLLFYEMLEGICFRNKGVFILDTLICPNGAQAGTVQPTCVGLTTEPDES